MPLEKQNCVKIAFVDSGVGGLSIWREVCNLISGLSTIYVADQAHVPYGPRPAEEVRNFAAAISGTLINQGVRVIVLASNTTSAAALYSLRECYPKTIFVGMEPALKPAISSTKTGIVGVLATPGTLQGQPFARLMDRFSEGVRVLTQPCSGWVEAVERGDLNSPQTMELVHKYVQPLLDAGADQLVLGCTHYPFLKSLIEKVSADTAKIVDPSVSVAQQAVRMLEQVAELSFSEAITARHQFVTTGTVKDVERHLNQLLNGFFSWEIVQGNWKDGAFLC
ncbi:glutamate racemase [bacterium]|nr:glutamate racemase [bacterium]